MALFWYITDAAFEFEDPDDYENWKQDPKVFFEFNIEDTDDGGRRVFKNPEKVKKSIELNDDDPHELEVTLAETGPVISARILVNEPLNEELTAEDLEEWSSEMNGWFAASMLLGEDAHIISDDGGSWELSED